VDLLKDVDSTLGSLHPVDAGGATDVSEVHFPPFSEYEEGVHVYAGFSHTHGGRVRPGARSRTKRTVSYEGHGVHEQATGNWCSHAVIQSLHSALVGLLDQNLCIHEYSLNLLISTLRMETVYAYETSESLLTSKRCKEPSTGNHHERPESVIYPKN
jgi:hypothetical protein